MEGFSFGGEGVEGWKGSGEKVVTYMERDVDLLGRVAQILDITAGAKEDAEQEDCEVDDVEEGGCHGEIVVQSHLQVFYAA